MGVEEHADGGGELGRGEFGGHAGERDGGADAGGCAEEGLGNVEEVGELGTAAGEDAAGAEGFENAAFAEVVAEHGEEFTGAGFENFGEEALTDEAGCGMAAGGKVAADFDFVERGNAGDNAVAVLDFELLGFFLGDVETDGEVVGEVVAADGKDGGMGDGALEEDDEFGGGGTDVGHADAELAFIGGKDGLGGGDALVDGVDDLKAGAIGAGNDRLGDAAGAGGEVEVDFELGADHADGVVDAGLVVEDELLGEEVQDFAIGGKCDGACAVDGGADLFAGDFAHAGAHGDAAARVDAANVGTADADDGGFDFHFGEAFGGEGGAVDGVGGGAEFGDEAFAHALGFFDAVAAVAEDAVLHLGDEDAAFRAARVENGDEVVVGFFQRRRSAFLCCLPMLLRMQELWSSRGSCADAPFGGGVWLCHCAWAAWDLRVASRRAIQALMTSTRLAMSAFFAASFPAGCLVGVAAAC